MMDVSFEVGILNMAQFYKLFKRHNQCSPKEFKQRMRSQTGSPSWRKRINLSQAGSPSG